MSLHRFLLEYSKTSNYDEGGFRGKKRKQNCACNKNSILSAVALFAYAEEVEFKLHLFFFLEW